MSLRVVVVDYGLGNLHSVIKSVRHHGMEPAVVTEASGLVEVDRLILPGVGAFGDGMAGLRQRGLVDPIRRHVAAGKPLLGICLGMQMLLGESEEFGRHEGLGIIPGRVVALAPGPGFKVPHMGWNRIAPPPGSTWAGTVLEKVTAGSMVYFVHSFTAEPADEVDRLADTEYGGQRVSAAVRCGNVIGCQFHPEKSGEVGLEIWRRFLAP